MSKTIDRAIAHYEFRKNEMRPIHIPEWAEEGEDQFFYATPLTLYDRQKINAKTKKDKDGDHDSIDMTANVLIAKLLKKDGTKAFTIADKPFLVRDADPDVVGRVGAEIVGGSNEALEQAEKN